MSSKDPVTKQLHAAGKSFSIRLSAIAAVVACVFLLQACRVETVTTSDNSSSSTAQTTASSASSVPTTSRTTESASSESSRTEPSASESSHGESTDPSLTSTSTTSVTSSVSRPATSTAPATSRPVQTTTAAPTTVATTAAPTTTTAAPPAQGAFKYVNYGTFFRDNYGSNANYITAEYQGAINITLDIGSAPNGVVLVKIDLLPSNVRCLVQVTKDGGNLYQYDILKRGTFVGIPLNSGNGSYQVAVAFDAGNNTFPAPLVHTFNVSLASSLKPYTASSIITDFSRGSSAVALAGSLCSGQSSLDGKIDAVYNWIVSNISYNRELNRQIMNGSVRIYYPNPDSTLSSRTGICYDYASLMCAMLRSQGIPTRLIMGDTPLGYHAWNEVFIDGVGWVVVAGFSWRELSGASWVRFDTTFAAGGMTSQEIKNSSYTTARIY